MADDTLHAIEAHVDALRGHVLRILENARNGGWPSAEARADVERLAALVDALAADTTLERQNRDVESEHLGDVLDAIYAVAALDFSRRATVRGDGPLDALAMSINMLAEELDEAQRRLVESRAAAEAATVAKSRFLAQMSHEIRTPLTALLGFADMLAAPALSDSDRLNYAMIVRRNGEHLLSVINDILDLSKIEAGKLQLEIIECSPALVLSDIESLMRARATESGLGFDVRLDTPIPAAFRTDPTRLRQVLLNIIGNAIKFTQRGSVRVVVRFDPPTSILRFDVVDTGIGMTEEQIGRLFQPFEQADLSMTRRYGGSGLGLAISKGLVTALGGEIGAVSVPGQGSTFSVTLPVATTAASAMISGLTDARRAAVGTPSAAAQFAGTILLAEDGPDNQILITTLLRKYGLTVGVAENGALALDRTLSAAREGTPYDLVLMDMQMPVMDGYEATRRLRKAGYRGPVVALTAHAMGGERERCVAAGCDDYMRKPIDRSELIATLERYVSRKRQTVPPKPEPAAAPAAAAPATAAEPLVSTFADDPDMAEIVERFVASLPDRIAALRVDAAAGARQSVQRLAHQLKGAAGGYGFPAITEAAAALERAAAQDDADVGRLIDELGALCSRARARAT